MKILYFLIFCVGISVNMKSQTNDCLKDFDFLVQKIKTDYPGYGDKVTAKSRQSLLQLEQELKNKIQLYPDSCGKYLSSYASWFKDNHLRVRRISSRPSSNDKNQSEPKFFPGNLDSIQLFNTNNNSIEGLWHSFGGDLAILKSTANNEFIGVSISYNNYKKRQIVFSLIKLDGDEYAMTSYPSRNNFNPLKGKASVRLGNKILELHNDTRFVRKTNSSTFDNALLYSYFPEFPNGSNTFSLALSLSDSTFYIRIPGFEDNVAEILARKHWAEIISRPNLIIDIRNNGGGQDNFYKILADLIYTNPYESKGVEWYASKNNIQMLEDHLKIGDLSDGEEGIRWTNSLLDAMKKIEADLLYTR